MVMLPKLATLTTGLFLVVHLGLHAADYLFLGLLARHRRSHYQQAVIVIHNGPLILIEAEVDVFFVFQFREASDVAQACYEVVELIVVSYWGTHAKRTVSSLEEVNVLRKVYALELGLVVIDKRHQQHIEWRIGPNEFLSINGKQGYRILGEVVDVITFTATR